MTRSPEEASILSEKEENLPEWPTEPDPILERMRKKPLGVDAQILAAQMAVPLPEMYKRLCLLMDAGLVCRSGIRYKLVR